MPATELQLRLARCMVRDRLILARRASSLATSRGNRPPHALDAAISRAQERRAARAASVPRPRYDRSLPIAARKDEIVRAIRDNQVVVLCGQTGSGKSTQLPLMCLEAGLGVDGLIAHTQPRRIAARTIAARLAQELGVPLGRAVGYKVRFTDETAPGTFIKVMTDGVLLAETQRDRLLARYDAVIIDEAHERGLNIDFLLGYLKQLLPRRRDLRLVITSATIDPDRFSRFFDNALVIEVSGRTYPVELRHRPPVDASESTSIRELLDAVDELLDGTPGDILAFLAGEREILDAAKELRRHAAARRLPLEILPLYARLSASEQLRAFTPGTARRVILATNIAETSVTVPGIRSVVDTCHARISRYSPRTGVQGLAIEPISRASADQRSGRCGREAPGVCIRLCSPADDAQRPPFTDPEIVRSNLAGVILRMKALRLGSPEDFPFIDRPSPRMLRDGIETLAELGAIDPAGELTPIGRRMAELHVDPRLARMLLASDAEHALHETLIIVSALAVQDPRERPSARRDEADAAHREFAHATSDFLTFVRLWDLLHAPDHPSSRRAAARWCADRFLSARRVADWRELYRQLRAMTEELGLRVNTEPAPAQAVHRSLLAGMLGHVAHAGERNEYKGTRGTELFIHPSSVLWKKRARWIIAWDIVRTTKLYARLAAPIKPEWIAELGVNLLDRSHAQPAWDDRLAIAAVAERTSLFGLVLPLKRRIPYACINPVHARELFIQHALVEGLHRPDAAYVEHNESLIRDLRRLEDKFRRRDILADSIARFAFFDRRLPPEVWSGRSFERWRARAERRDPHILFMSEQDLRRPNAEPPAPDLFPDSLNLPGTRTRVEYCFDPGREDDGATLRVPLASLASLSEGVCDWLIPGLVRERVLTLLRAVPRALRRGIGPANVAADDFFASSPDHDRPLADALADFIARTRGVNFPPEAWEQVDMPPHLRARLVVVDDQGVVVGEGRDVRTLRASLGLSIREAVRRAAPEAFNCTNLREWNFPDLPDEVPLCAGDATIRAVPALIADPSGRIDLRVVPDTNEARLLHAQGVRALAAISLRQSIRREMDTSSRPLRLYYAALGHPTPIEQEVTLLAISLAAHESLAVIRSKAAFNSLRDKLDRELPGAAAKAIVLAADILSAAHATRLVIPDRIPPAWRDPIAEIRAHTERLLAPSFLSATPPDRLRHFPRYLRAAEIRVRKLSDGGLERDARLAAELRPRVERAASLTPQEGRPEVAQALDRYRWLIEEWRVSLFAQELGAACRVSAQRVDEQWGALRQALRAGGAGVVG